MILCDTNILIDIYKGNDNIIKIAKEIGQENIAVSDITCAELYFGARNKQELGMIKKDMGALIILPIDNTISNLAVNLVEKYALSHKLSIPDALIEATAVINNIKLFTLNIKDFKYIENVSLYEI
jgi:predicted nucleic acid-binding protein